MEFTDKQKRAIIITVAAILLILILFLVAIIATISRDIHTNNNIDVSTGFSSIKEIIEYHESKYIKDSYDKGENFSTTIEVEFKYKLYDGDESNERFFNSVINDIAKFINYTNFEILDKKNDIKIQVVCSNRKIQTIIINDIEDYFIHMNSQLELSKYEEIKTVSLNASSPVLQNLISNSWQSYIDFGSRDEVFKNYFIFFDEGIEYKKIGSTVYNIVFTSNYGDYVVDYITPNASIASIKATLGEPQFEDEELGVIGYKGNEFYAFFNGEEISIYKNITTDYTEFWRLVDRFIDEDSGLEFKEFMNELTYIWKDYSEYNYNEDYMFISYPNKGIDVKLNYEGVSGIIVYNNISENLNRVKRYLEHSEFISNLKLDDVFEAEKRRLIEKANLKEKCDEYKEFIKEKYSEEDLEMIGESLECDYYFEFDDDGYTISAYFIPTNKGYCRRELNESIYRYMWLDSHRILYSIYGKGIYVYDVFTGEKRTIIEDTEEFYLKSYEGNVLSYDNMKMTVELY